MRRLAVLLPLLFVAPLYAQTLTVASPGGALVVALDLDDEGAPLYRVRRGGRDLVLPSRLGVVFREGPRFDTGLRVLGTATATRDTTWETVWGERQFVRDHHNEGRVAFADADGARIDLVVRVFDDGLGFRYEWPEQPALADAVITDERTAFRFAEAPEAWWIPAYQRERYEYLYRHTPLAEAGRFQADVNVDTPSQPHPYRPAQAVHTPLTLRFPESGLYAAIHEAALVDYASMTLVVDDAASVHCDLVPWSDGAKVYATAPFVSPWRVLLVGETPGALAESDLVLNLNEPSRIEDPSWIEPQKYVGIWWAMHIDQKTWHSGDRHGATTEEAERYIDFAADHGFGGVLVEGWNRGWDRNWIGLDSDFSFTEPYPDFDLEAVARYARARGVRLIGHHETGGDVPTYEAQLDAAMALYARLGVRAVKTGYVEWEQGVQRVTPEGDSTREWHHGQYMVRHHQRVVETAARHGIMVNIHEPIKDTGLRRTWPNLMTREGARGMEYNAWSRDGGNPPEHETVLPFTRLLAGPFDFTPGIVDLTLPRKPANRVNTTLAKQLALYVALYSPLQMAADLPEHYEARPDALRFIEDVPVDWADSRVLHGAIGDVIVMARKDRGSEDWYLGAVTDEEGRTLSVPLDFLHGGRRYVAEVYRDADDAHWETNPEALTLDEGLVDAATVLPLRLAPGGGLAARFRAASADEEAAMPRLVP